MIGIARMFLDDQRARLAHTRQRLTGVINQLSDEDLNWRPNPESNEVSDDSSALVSGTFPSGVRWSIADGNSPARSEPASDTGTPALRANCPTVSWPRTSVSCAAETGGLGPVEIQLEPDFGLLGLALLAGGSAHLYPSRARADSPWTGSPSARASAST